MIRTKPSVYLYKSADIERNLTITFDPMDGFGHKRNHFGVVFLSQTKDGFKTVLYCTKQLTNMRYYCNF